MELKQDFVFRPLPPIPPDPSSVLDTATTDLARAKALEVAPDAPSELGPLQGLLGAWKGTGFNMIWRPFHSSDPTVKQRHFLELDLTLETLEVEEVKGAIPNRGLLQPDINMFGVHYLQQIQDLNVGAALHFEPGIWLNIPATTNPEEPPTVARLGSIPHGTSILAQGTAFTVQGPPRIDPVSITPFVIGNPDELVPFPESDLSFPTPFRSSGKQIDGITQEMVDNPNSVLTAAIAGQTIKETTVLVITSDPNGAIAGGGTANTAFLQGAPPNPRPNANAALVTAIFWIETVQGENGEPDFQQLQYTQTVLLDFGGLSWPHVSVATMRLPWASGSRQS